MSQLEKYNNVSDSKIKLKFSLCVEEDLGKEKPDWIPYSLELTVENERYIINEFSICQKSVEELLEVFKNIIEERAEFTDYDESSNKSISTVPFSERIQIEYDEFEFLSDECEFKLKVQNIEDYYDDIIVIFQIWLNSAAVLGKRQGYFIGYDFNVTYDGIQTFYNSLKKQYEKIIN